MIQSFLSLIGAAAALVSLVSSIFVLFLNYFRPAICKQLVFKNFRRNLLQPCELLSASEQRRASSQQNKFRFLPSLKCGKHLVLRTRWPMCR